MKKLINAVVLLILCSMSLSAFGSIEDTLGKIEITGIIRIIGNEPFTEVMIETSEGEGYILEGEKTEELRLYQGKIVSLEGESGSGGRLTVSYFTTEAEPLHPLPTR